MEIIPAIDIVNGKAVRLTKGNYADQKIYSHNPIEVAKSFENAGAQIIHIVDLNGAKTGSQQNFDLIAQIAASVSCRIEVGGGVRNGEVIYKLLNSRVYRVILGTIALENIDFVKEMIDKYGAERIVVGVDAKKGMVATRGWLDVSEIKAINFVKDLEKVGVRTIIYTDIDKDGMMQGPNINEIEDVMKNFNGEIIASGGVSAIEDIEKLNKINVQHAIVGKAIYEGNLPLSFLRRQESITNEL